MTSWWQSIWEWLVGTETRPVERAAEQPAPAPLWIEPLEERVVVGLFSVR